MSEYIFANTMARCATLTSGSRLALLDRGSGDVLAEYVGHVNEAAKVDSCLTTGKAVYVCFFFFFQLNSGLTEVKYVRKCFVFI